MKAMINSGDGIVGIDEQPDDIIVILMIILLWYKDKMKNREKITGDEIYGVFTKTISKF